MSKAIQLYRNAVLFANESAAIANLSADSFKGGMQDGMIAAARYKEDNGPIKTVFAIYHKDKATNVVTETIFNPESVPQKVIDMFQQISINGHKLFGEGVEEEGVVVLDGADLNVGGTGVHKDDTVAESIESLYASLTGLDITEEIAVSGAKKETVSLAGTSKAFQIPSIIKAEATTTGSTATYKMVDYDGNQIGASIEIPADRIFKYAQIGDNADTFDETTGVITPAVTPSGEEVLHMVFVKADGTFEDVKLSLEKIVFEAEAGDGLQVNTEGGHVLSVKVDDASEGYLTVGENGVKISGLDDQFEVIASALNDLNDRTNANKESIDDIVAEAISIEGTAQQIKVTEGEGTTKIIGFADDAIFDCGEY